MARRGENIHKRKDGRWEARIIEGYHDGKSKYRSIYGKTYTEVRMKREEALVKLSLKPAPSAKKLASFDFIASDWLHSVRSSIKESTYTRYHRTVHVYLMPKLGTISLIKLSPNDINRISEELMQNGGKRGQGLSAKTISDILSVLKLILHYGTRQGYACPDTSNINSPKKKKPKVKTLCNNEIQRLEQLLWDSNDTISLGILFSLYTGVRIGELCGLRWEDINFNTGTVRISRTVERITDMNPSAKLKTRVVVSTPKTENGLREIPLPKALITFLEMKKSSGQHYLITGTNKHSEPHTLYIRYKRYLKRHEFDSYTFHALRHTFATRCIEAGFDAKSLSEILGHSDVSTTLRCYVHTSMEQKRQLMELLIPEENRGQKRGFDESTYNSDENIRCC